MSSLTDYLDKRLREAFDYHGLCPDCEGLLVCCGPGMVEANHAEHEGAWCPLCGYTRSTLMRPKP